MKGHSREVKVFLRIRPTDNFAQDLIECLPDGQTVTIYQRKDTRKLLESKKSQLNLFSWSFQLDGVLNNVSQEELYSRVSRRVVLDALDGYNGTLMCFGQTGAGKTYTMIGSTESYKHRGIIPRALQEVFQEVKKRTEQSFSLHLSYLEIYNENLVDLLSSLQASPHLPSRGMTVMEEPGRGVFIRSLSLHPIHSEEEALNLLFEGEMNRIIGSHALNRKSSRSHCILTVHIKSCSRSLSNGKYITSKLNLVDLAGSERQGKSGSEGQMLKEATYINKSLSFLEQTILALADHGRDHVPFRQSKLTHALKGSLGENCNTVLVANIIGEAVQIEETLCTLRFASRVKRVRSSPTVNEHIDPAFQIKKLQKEVQMLKDELSMNNTLANRPGMSDGPLSEAQLAEIQNQVQRYLDGSLEEISITGIRQVQAAFAQFKLAIQMKEQRVKAQQCQSYNLEKKDQTASIASFKERDIRESPEGMEHGSFALLLESQKQTQHPSSTKDKSKTSKDKQRSPPPKAEAFETFKLGQGRKIKHILEENKAVLLERRSHLHQLSKEVNTMKTEIDCTIATLKQHEDMREVQGQDLVKDGDRVLQQPEDSLLVQLGELKAQYCQRYEVLRSIKAEVNYCQHLVDQCRVRLLSEFETWYEQSFKLPEESLDVTLNKSCTQRNSRVLSSMSAQKNTSAGSGPRTLPPILPVTKGK